MIYGHCFAIPSWIILLEQGKLWLDQCKLESGHLMSSDDVQGVHFPVVKAMLVSAFDMDGYVSVYRKTKS